MRVVKPGKHLTRGRQIVDVFVSQDGEQRWSRPDGKPYWIWYYNDGKAISGNKANDLIYRIPNTIPPVDGVVLSPLSFALLNVDAKELM